MALYYKLGNNNKAKKYLNNSLKKDNAGEDYYIKGSSLEVAMYMNNYKFLIISMNYLSKFVLQN